MRLQLSQRLHKHKLVNWTIKFKSLLNNFLLLLFCCFCSSQPRSPGPSWRAEKPAEELGECNQGERTQIQRRLRELELQIKKFQEEMKLSREKYDKYKLYGRLLSPYLARDISILGFTTWTGVWKRQIAT